RQKQIPRTPRRWGGSGRLGMTRILGNSSTGRLHCRGHRKNFPTQAKTGLEWGTPEILGPRLAPKSGANLGHRIADLVALTCQALVHHHLDFDAAVLGPALSCFVGRYGIGNAHGSRGYDVAWGNIAILHKVVNHRVCSIFT